MAFDSKGLDDYVDVAQRIADFRERYPDGSLQPLDTTAPFEIRKVDGTTKDGKDFTATFIIYIAAAYRDRDDPRPGVGMAWEVFPGRTPYTLGSELMNAETSAQGRAIVAALAADSKKGVASREEVRNRRAERDDSHTPAPAPNGHKAPPQRSAQAKGKPVHDGSHETPWDTPMGTSTPAGRTANIDAHFKRLGVEDAGVQNGYIATLIGHAVTKRSELAEAEQLQLLDDLAHCRNRQALDRMRAQRAGQAAGT